MIPLGFPVYIYSTSHNMFIRFVMLIDYIFSFCDVFTHVLSVDLIEKQLKDDIDSFVQDCSNSIAKALGLL